MKQWRHVGAVGTRTGNQSPAWGIRYTTEGGTLSFEGYWGLLFFQGHLYSSWGRKVGQMMGGHWPPGDSPVDRMWTL